MITEEHRLLIDSTLARYGLKPNQLEIVESIADWCRESGYCQEDDPFRAGYCLCRTSDGDCHILLAAELTQDMFASHKDAMTVLGLGEQVETLQTPEDSLLHLVLHEIACHVLSDRKQVPRDKWAFEQMALIRSERGDASR